MKGSCRSRSCGYVGNWRVYGAVDKAWATLNSLIPTGFRWGCPCLVHSGIASYPYIHSLKPLCQAAITALFDS